MDDEGAVGFEMSAIGERLTQIALVVGLIVALQLAAGAAVATELTENANQSIDALAGAASGVVLECFAAACLLRWARGPLTSLARSLIVVESAIAAALILLDAVVKGVDTFSVSRGLGLFTLASFGLAAAGVLFGGEIVTWWMTDLDDGEREPEPDGVDGDG